MSEISLVRLYTVCEEKFGENDWYEPVQRRHIRIG